MVICFCCILLALLIAGFRMVWVIGKAADIDLERRIELDRQRATRFQEYKNASGPEYWQQRLGRAQAEAETE